MKILVRLPNWLGDMVMSTAFIIELKKIYPEAEISVIVKRGFHTLLENFPAITSYFVFSKEEHPGLKGVYKFGKIIAKKNKFDIFYCLPNSLSSALMGVGTGAKKRIGYRNELRSVFFTNAYKKNKSIHRVEQYTGLLNLYNNHQKYAPVVSLEVIKKIPSDHIIVNINSEASSRRLPKEKAISLINLLRESSDLKIYLIGSAGEKGFVDEVFSILKNTAGIYNIAAQTSLPQLIEIMSDAKVMLSTDSGPAHLCNAIGIPTIVLFGAGDESITSPYNKSNCTVIRLGELSCEPCQKNICIRFGVPKCLTLLNEEKIISEVLKHV